MSDVDEIDDDGTDEQKPTKGNALREQNSKLHEQNAALKAQLDKLLAQDRTRTIADTLREKGANAKLAKYVARDLDGQDVTADAVDKWLAEEGELFGYKPADSDEEDDPADAERARQQQRVADATARAPQPSTGPSVENIRNLSFQQMIDSGMVNPD